MEKLAVLLLVAAAVTASGCTGDTPKVGANVSAEKSVSLQGNSSQTVTLEITNKLNTKASYHVTVAAPEVAEILNPETGEKVSEFETGKIKPGQTEQVKTLKIRGKPEALGNRSSEKTILKFITVTQAPIELTPRQEYSLHEMEITVRK